MRSMVRSSGMSYRPSLCSSQATATAPTWDQGSAASWARTSSTSASISGAVLLATRRAARDCPAAQLGSPGA